MILKNKDSSGAAVARLEQKLQDSSTESQRARAKKDLAQLRACIRSQKEAAYHIDFYLKDNPNWIVIHDLRLEWNDHTAQIDHLILGCGLEAYVVESRNYGTKVRWAEGVWEKLVSDRWESIPSPVEQNERHISLLDQLIKDHCLVPMRLGMLMPITFFSVIQATGPLPQTGRVRRMEALTERIAHEETCKAVSPETLLNLGNKLLRFHKPVLLLAPAPLHSEIGHNGRLAFA